MRAILWTSGVLLAACGGGVAEVVGPVLNFPATNTLTCQDGIIVQVNPTFPQPTAFEGAGSCLYLTTSAGPAANQPVMQPPRAGRVTSATLRAGPVTGPMRFVRMRVLFQHGLGAACCAVEQYGEVFVPAPNADTTVPLSFPITVEPLPAQGDLDTIAANDWIGLEVLAPDVPIPGIWRRDGGQEPFLDTSVWLPALSPQGVVAPSNNLRSTGSFNGFMPAFNFVLESR
jgi:hypothetical protein